MILRRAYLFGQTPVFSFICGGLFWLTINLISWARVVLKEGEVTSGGWIAFCLIILFGCLGAELNVAWSNVRGTHEPIVQIAILIGCFGYYAATSNNLQSNPIVMTVWASSMTIIRMMSAAIWYYVKRVK